jgi:hypothetical protein
MKAIRIFISALALLSTVANVSRASMETEVDLELVLAVDISYSMDLDELATQRQGYIKAITSPEVLKAISRGTLGRVAVTYVEWAGVDQQTVVIPWQLIDGVQSAGQFAGMLAEAPVVRAYRTSISGALTHAATLFDRNNFSGLRRVIDMSGDGPNNNGPPVIHARDEVLAKGISINGLPLMLDRTDSSSLGDASLEDYYRDCVIGGAGAFLVPVNGVGSFEQAVRTKMVLEIAALEPKATVQKAKARPRTPCVIGEVMWQQRFGP